MTDLKIVVADDEESAAGRWAEDIREAAPEGSEISALSRKELTEACDELESRRKAARSGDPPPNGKWAFDDTDIAVVDYDLLEATSVTGAQVAHLLRSYSACKVIVELNRYGINNFDLNLDSRAGDYSDLLLGSKQVGNAGLWNQQWRGYRPWHWPLLPLAPSAHHRRIESVRGNLEKPILDVLDLPSEVREALTRDVIEFFLPPGEDDPNSLKKVTFRTFVDEAPGGREEKDRLADDEGYLRVAAARVHTWLNRIIVPRQDVLIDAPHLASRYPSLLTDSTSLEDWNKTPRLSSDLKELGLDQDAIEQHRWQNVWIDRPVWFWPLLSRDESILEISRPAEREDSGYVFCEDISAFVPREDAQDFRSELSSPFRRRFVSRPDLVVSDESLADLKGRPEDPTGVEYTPKIALAY